MSDYTCTHCEGRLEKIPGPDKYTMLWCRSCGLYYNAFGLGIMPIISSEWLFKRVTALTKELNELKRQVEGV
jgi:hypothetical protein